MRFTCITPAQTAPEPRASRQRRCVLGPTDLGKYLMRSSTCEIIFGGETRPFWDFRGPNGLSLDKLQNDIQPWQVRRTAEYMTHAPNASLTPSSAIPPSRSCRAFSLRCSSLMKSVISRCS